MQTAIVHGWLLVRVHTDTGISGVGEATFFTQPESVAAIVRSFRGYLLGADPFRIDHHWQYLYRSASFRGAALSAALSAIDVALWDIVGKHYGAPVCNLLGGRSRDKVRMCALVITDETEALVEGLSDAVRQGYTAVKIDPIPREFPSMSLDRLVEEVVTRVGAARETVGPDVDIGVEFHRRLGPGEAVVVARELEQFHPLFLEDPIQPDSIRSMADVAGRINVPVATGERLHTVFEFRELLESRAAAHVKPDVGLAGGLTQGKKICAIAESYHAGVMPHNFLSPVTTAAHVQLCAAIPNFVVLEHLPEDQPPRSEVVVRPLPVRDGYIEVPDTPGIGVEFNEDAPQTGAGVELGLDTPLKEDGSVAYR